MKNTNRLFAVTLLIAGLQLAGCSKGADAPAEETPQFTVERSDIAQDPTKIILTEEANTRLDIQTAAARQADVKGTSRHIIPFAAVLYDTEGATWAYTSPAPLTYVRHSIKVEFIEGEDAVLSEALAPDTKVVTVGGAELFGSETEFSEE